MTRPGGFFDMIDHPPEAEAPVLTDDERAIAELADHPGWLALRAQMDAHEEAWGQRIANQITKGTKPLDQTKITYTRGYFAGMRNLVGRVTAAKTRTDEERQS